MPKAYCRLASSRHYSRERDPTYGYSFASRPSALKFWYKYSPRNSADYGYAEVLIKDADGNVIAEGKSNLNATGNYTQHTFALDYAAGSAKAATICVAFRSSNNPACQTISNDNLTNPGLATSATAITRARSSMSTTSS